MALTLTTIGIKVSYAFETVAGTRPTSGYVRIPEVKSIPAMDAAPDTLETTSFDNLEFKTYVDGLKDLGGVLDFTANYSQELVNIWQGVDGVMSQWDAAKAAGLAMYICIDIPGLDKSCYIEVIPSKLGLPGAEVNAVLEATLHFTPVGEPVWDIDPTYDGTTLYTVTVSGYVVAGVDIAVLKGDTMAARFTTKTTSTAIELPEGTYTFIGRKEGKTSQVVDKTVSGNTSVSFATFA